MKASKAWLLALATILPSAAATLGAQPAGSDGFAVTITNPSDWRRQEVVEVPQLNDDGNTWVVTDDAGNEVTSQTAQEGGLLIDVDLPARGKATYTVRKGSPRQVRPAVHGAFYKIRKDDIAWENDKIIFRMYGPALQRSGERSFGTDVWVKNTPELVMDSRYWIDYRGNQLEGELRKAGKRKEEKQVDDITSFHIDHGNGMDSYAVGPTLGCGAPALFDGRQLFYPWCYDEGTILDNGPLRFAVRLSYPPVSLNGRDSIVEHRVVTLDKYSHFSRCTVWYTGGDNAGLRLAAGFVVHDDSPVITKRDYAAYADPSENFGPDKTFVAVVAPDGAQEPCLFEQDDARSHKPVEHALCFPKLAPGEKNTYWFGAAWSKYDIPSLEAWQAHVERFVKERRQPLKIKVKALKP